MAKGSDFAGEDDKPGGQKAKKSQANLKMPRSQNYHQKSVSIDLFALAKARSSFSVSPR